MWSSPENSPRACHIMFVSGLTANRCRNKHTLPQFERRHAKKPWGMPLNCQNAPAPRASFRVCVTETNCHKRRTLRNVRARALPYLSRAAKLSCIPVTNRAIPNDFRAGSPLPSLGDDVISRNAGAFSSRSRPEQNNFPEDY